MIAGACHCGKVRLEVPDRPDALTLCNCSICRRHGALWAFYMRDEVRVTGHPEHTTGYVWGDRTIRYVSCRDCGCVTHWEPMPHRDDPRLCLNMRNFDPVELGELPLKRFDGADTWRYLD